MKKEQWLTYKDAGVSIDNEKQGIESLVAWVKRTLPLSACPTKMDFGYFANVIEISPELGLAISTDGVGTKIMIAQMMEKYDTIGIDCVAMNVNDILCVGAKPVAMVDYIAVQSMESHFLSQIGKGLYQGALLAKIAIPGGEIAQIKEMLSPDKDAFDLVGTCVGVVNIDQIIDGSQIKEGDVLIGIQSSGIHSNGFSLARKALFHKARHKINAYVEEAGKTLGELLLEPTIIYVAPVMEMLSSAMNVKALVHITGGGLLNLNRVHSAVGFMIDSMPETPPIFRFIQKAGNVQDEEMHRVFNMGVGFCVVTSPESVELSLTICQRHNLQAFKLGYAVADHEKKIILQKKALVGIDNQFVKWEKKQG
jgi:phosphoribosylformylglycinamidine cyclo-ligase